MFYASHLTRDELVHVLLEGLHINLCVVLGPEAVVMLVLQVDIHSAGSRHVHCVGHSCARGRWCTPEQQQAYDSTMMTYCWCWCGHPLHDPVSSKLLPHAGRLAAPTAMA